MTFAGYALQSTFPRKHTVLQVLIIHATSFRRVGNRETSYEDCYLMSLKHNLLLHTLQNSITDIRFCEGRKVSCEETHELTINR